jgi:MoaA/NifB/PqqE/SkfB family radical SAM enzyme
MTQITNTANIYPEPDTIVTDETILQSITNEYLSIEVTTECNSNCVHCFASAGLTKRNTLDMETARSVMEEGFELGYRTLHVTGGEPLLWPHLMRLLGEAFEAGYPSAFINTNGTLFSNERCGNFARYGDKLSFSLSLHGPEELHESIRGKGSYKQTIDGLKNALDYGLKINIFTSVGKSLLKKLPEFVNSVYTNFPGIDYMALIQLIRVHQDSFDLSDELMEPKNFIQFVQTASMLSLYGLKVRIIENPLVNPLADLLNIKWLPPEPSMSRPGRAVIMADRNITIYHSSRDSFGIYSPGVLKKRLFSDAYKNAVAVDCSGCGDCPHKEICERNKIRRPSEWFRDMHPKIPYCRRVLDEACREWNSPQ